MDQSVHIVTDSSCDLPRRLLDELGIAVAPLQVHIGEETHRDGELSLDEFWARVQAGQSPKTSQPPAGVFEELFEGPVSQGKRVLCLTVTSKHSGTINSAYAAAQRFGGAVEVVDSQSLSLGLGLQAFAAATAARTGQSMQEILTLLESLRERIKLNIVLDTLENLRRGGRADSFISIVDRMTRALNVKPIINVVDGQLKLLGAARSFKRGLDKVFKQIEDIAPLEYLAVVHTRRQELAEQVADRLSDMYGYAREQIWMAETGPALASHAGPGVIGVLVIPAT